MTDAVSRAEGTQSAASSASSQQSKKNAVNYEAFLKLLVAQMQNQDPTSPADSAQYLSQLASFASVEQGVASNKRLDQLLASSTLSNAQNMIGRQISNADGSISGLVKTVEIDGTNAVAVLTSGDKISLNQSIILGAK